MQVIASVAGVLAVIAMSGAAGAAKLDYTWKKGPLVVFAAGEDDAALAEQRRIVRDHRAALAERDVVVIWVVGNAASAEFGAPPRATADALRGRYGVGKDAFRVVLVGKDGGVKLSRSSPIQGGELSRTIDAMPMRREEMRQR